MIFLDFEVVLLHFFSCEAMDLKLCFPGEVLPHLMTVEFVGHVGVCCWREMLDSLSLKLFAKLACEG